MDQVMMYIYDQTTDKYIIINGYDHLCHIDFNLC